MWPLEMASPMRQQLCRDPDEAPECYGCRISGGRRFQIEGGAGGLAVRIHMASLPRTSRVSEVPGAHSQGGRASREVRSEVGQVENQSIWVLGPGKELGFLSTYDSGHGRVENWE